MAKTNETETITRGIKSSQEILDWFEEKKATLGEKDKAVQVMIEKFIEIVKEHRKGLKDLLGKKTGK